MVITVNAVMVGAQLLCAVNIIIVVAVVVISRRCQYIGEDKDNGTQRQCNQSIFAVRRTLTFLVAFLIGYHCSQIFPRVGEEITGWFAGLVLVFLLRALLQSRLIGLRLWHDVVTNLLFLRMFKMHLFFFALDRWWGGCRKSAGPSQQCRRILLLLLFEWLDSFIFRLCNNNGPGIFVDINNLFLLFLLARRPKFLCFSSLIIRDCDNWIINIHDSIVTSGFGQFFS
mmetsp:Transcript_5559/g.11405  ORF Transcript_5559/g.11405 Transcript_5559/m.11405 type:complete len:227 (-) Transcript_5559:181-861(-)